MLIILRRGLAHMFVGLSIAVAVLLLPRVVLLIPLGVVSFILLAVDILRFRNLRMKRWFSSFFKPLLREEEGRSLTSASYMFVASFIALLVFQRDIVVLILCFLAVGDAVAKVIGSYIGKRRLFGKTLEGSLACFVSCIMVGFALYYAGLSVSPLVILLGSISATVIEAMPFPINDNLTMPLSAGLVIMVMQL